MGERDRIEKVISVGSDRTAADDAVVGCSEGGRSYREQSQEAKCLVRLCWEERDSEGEKRGRREWAGFARWG